MFLHIYNGTEKNTFTYYEDDGNTFDYKSEKFCKRNIQFDPVKKQILFESQEGTYVSVFRVIKIIMHGFNDAISLSVNGQPQKWQNENIRLFNPLEDLNDIYDKNYYKSLADAIPAPAVKTVTIANSVKPVKITW